MTDNRRFARRKDDVEIKTLTHVIEEFMDETRQTAEDARKSRDSLHAKLGAVEEKVDIIETKFLEYRPLMDTIKNEREDEAEDRRQLKRTVMSYVTIAALGIVAAALLFYFAHQVGATSNRPKAIKVIAVPN